MFGSTVLEVAVGLTFCYATVALIVSTIQEALASALHMRPRRLLDAVCGMLADPGYSSLALAVYRHALVNPHDPAQADARALAHKPAYIDPAHFAIALREAVQTIPDDFVQLGRDIDAIADPALKRALQGFYQRANGDVQAFELALVHWFNAAMERVSSAYKRSSMVISLLLSLLLAMLFNIDSIHLFRALWQHPALAAQIDGASTTVSAQTIDALMTLPIGWRSFPPALDDSLALSVVGWLLTASTALFGAPFWFDLMKRTVQVRGDARP